MTSPALEPVSKLSRNARDATRQRAASGMSAFKPDALKPRSGRGASAGDPFGSVLGFFVRQPGVPILALCAAALTAALIKSGIV